MKKQKGTKLTFYFSVLLFTLLFLGCTSDEDEKNNIIETNNPVVESQINMSVSKSTINFGYIENTHSFLLTNIGDTPFDWNWTEISSTTFLSASPSSGTLAAGSSIEIYLTLDRSNMTTQVYNVATKINNNKGQSLTQIIEISNYTEEKWLIGGNVIDAEYDRVNDVMIVVSENPNQIRKFNMSNNVVETLLLNYVPKCLSISQSGNYAVVGHNGSLSHINLSSMTIENNFVVTTDVYDIVLAPNNWAYITSINQYEKMRCINLTNGQELFSQYNTPSAKCKIKLHPSGNYIYLTSYYILPSDFYKYNISNGIAEFLYDSIYHGDYEFGENLWFSENGDKIFGQGKNVFSSSSTQYSDMIYINSLEELVGDNNKVIDIMDIHTNSQMIYALFIYDPHSYVYIPSNKIRKYNTQFSYISEVEIPDFMSTNSSGEINFHDSSGYFGFFNTSGTKFFVLVKSFTLNQWAIATINVT
ncbi:hypothetical protein [uncultured Flavobacterium sp.]|uniref:hypothetical protein n=1 Tax=uncultured Flavobacterium sp. TaxID=165435 RepID=UPI0030EDAB3C|tara:strand:+ start:69249 stop:70667 length:1419 start_codon:yes stop_codon:yes gene_type:complete